MRMPCIRVGCLSCNRLSNPTTANIPISTPPNVKDWTTWSVVVAGKIGSVDNFVTTNLDLWWASVANRTTEVYLLCLWRSRDRLILRWMNLCRRVKICPDNMFLVHIKVIITRKMMSGIRITFKAVCLKIVERLIIVPIKRFLINH